MRHPQAPLTSFYGPPGSVCSRSRRPLRHHIAARAQKHSTKISAPHHSVMFSVRAFQAGDISAALAAPNGTVVDILRRTSSLATSAIGDSSDFGGDYRFIDSGANIVSALDALNGGQVLTSGDYWASNRTVPTTASSQIFFKHGLRQRAVIRDVDCARVGQRLIRQRLAWLGHAHGVCGARSQHVADVRPGLGRPGGTAPS